MTDEPPLRRRAAESRTGNAPHDPPPARPEPADVAADPTAGGPVPLTAPREGTPAPVATERELDEVVARFAAGTGPVALDAERASGYRYSQRAYLVQLRRAGAGTALVDPLPLPDLTALDEVIGEAEWVLHAASQDLPCLAELGLRPRRLFDTELAARLAGFERVGLAALTEQLLGFSLEKHHSAADWSTRPLPESWLTYAALDVELLTDLRDALDAELTRQGKSEWAAEEFAALVRTGARPPRVRAEPWRRTSGIHRVRGARAQARVRSMWYARDQIAARRDAAPGRVLPDSAIIAAAELDPKDEQTLLTLPGFGGRSVRRLARTWLAALDDARQLPDDALPVAPAAEGPPPPHRWAERDPVAAARLVRCREVVTRIAGEHNLPPENLIAPDSVRRLAWVPPEEVTDQTVADTLRGFNARSGEIRLLPAQPKPSKAIPPPNPPPPPPILLPTHPSPR
ncbi:HRDC domain-containing protein [Micromonospora sp. C28SCA-DRY-2]|uniref:ribonuclease D n=1 Tax=Micromonospora sp. C28SCA-DRY-2 TaxID=3059522 RepID=UPI00267640E9|nr:HRDC domain-containing protein [Micromonospora sp. C28SCA-DRY-2]MDO3700442.1 HRDC domain-containing protein [Micromonospora sp. C28SCA-DRY-2]